MISQMAKWIGIEEDIAEACPKFQRTFQIKDKVKQASLAITAIGVYQATINGKQVTDAVLTPGCTSYESRLQYQTYDVTELLQEENVVSVIIGKGWHRGRISASSKKINQMPGALILSLKIIYEDNRQEEIVSNEDVTAQTSCVLFSDLYDGEIYDASLTEFQKLTVVALDLDKNRLIPQEGELIKEHERILPRKLLITPKGETVIDFGQNFAGYPKISVTAKKGEKVKLSFAEILDKDGNFYTENYRSAQATCEYICHEGKQVYKPLFCFYGFRYVKVDEFPTEITLDAVEGIAVYSDIKRRGYIISGNDKLNKLYENVLWSQRSNFIDVPTDCPQRDERMGWTGDAQVFAKAAGYNYDVYQFFRKWLADVRAEQRTDGSVPDTVPNFWQLQTASTAWGDVICIVPWQMYLLFGKKEILEENFEAMKRWVDYISNDTKDPYLWTCEEKDKGLWKKHYGDWLALDAPYGSYKGKTDDDMIASAFYYASCSLVVKAGKVIGKNVGEYERLADKISETFRKRFSVRETQTDCVLPLYFGLLEKEEKSCAEQLVEMIKQNNGCLQTGFVGTPYLLHVLSENGYGEVAYDLLLNEKNPSWFYEVNHGATTIWEHWDGINDEGKVWSKDMNSYNHYAYGSVMDWVYSVAAGIQVSEEHPGFEEVIVEPHPDRRLHFLEARVETGYGEIVSKWSYEENSIRYEIKVPVKAKIIIDGRQHWVEKGTYIM